MLEVVNLFLVPLITYYILCKRKHRNMNCAVKDFVIYGISSVCVAVGTLIVLTAMELVIGVGADSTSKVYLFLSVIIAFCLPYIYEILSKYISIKLEIKERNGKK